MKLQDRILLPLRLAMILPLGAVSAATLTLRALTSLLLLAMFQPFNARRELGRAIDDFLNF